MVLLYAEGGFLLQPWGLDLVQVTQFLEQVRDWQHLPQGDSSEDKETELGTHREAWSSGTLLPADSTSLGSSSC